MSPFEELGGGQLKASSHNLISLIFFDKEKVWDEDNLLVIQMEQASHLPQVTPVEVVGVIMHQVVVRNKCLEL